MSDNITASTLKILRVDASARKVGSISRKLGDELIEKLQLDRKLDLVTTDLAKPPPVVTAEWVDANSTPVGKRSDQQDRALALSDGLVGQLEVADLLLITTPIYNFGIPAALKAWIDQIARAGRTFSYTEKGPVGLLKDKRAVVLLASGGTKVGSDIDFVTPYLKHVLGFVGILDVSFIAADALNRDNETAQTRARTTIDELSRSFQ